VLQFHVGTLEVQTLDNEDIATLWIDIKQPMSVGARVQGVEQTSVDADVIVRGFQTDDRASSWSVLRHRRDVVVVGQDRRVVILVLNVYEQVSLGAQRRHSRILRTDYRNNYLSQNSQVLLFVNRYQVTESQNFCNVPKLQVDLTALRRGTLRYKNRLSNLKCLEITVTRLMHRFIEIHVTRTNADGEVAQRYGMNQKFYLQHKSRKKGFGKKRLF